MINGEPINVNEINGSGIGTLAEQETIPSTATTTLLWFTATLPQVYPPDVTGKTLAQATALLQAQGFVAVSQYVYSAIYPEADSVIDQSPTAIQQVDYGSDVTITFSLGPEGT